MADSKRYRFRREGDGEIVEVSFEEAILQDAAGFIVLSDGVSAKRCPDQQPSDQQPLGGKVRPQPTDAGGRPIVSDRLGFGECQFADFEEHRIKGGHTGVRFKPDPEVPGYYLVECSSRGAWDAYVKSRGFYDKNKHSGSALSEGDFETASRVAKSSVESRQQKFARYVL